MSSSGSRSSHPHTSNPSSSHPQLQMPSLSTFLRAHHLSQYFHTFLEAGCTEVDVAQFLELNDEEIKEFATSVRLKPFHAVAFKKGIRELKEVFGLTHVPALVRQSSSSLSVDSFQFSSPSPGQQQQEAFEPPRKRFKSIDPHPSNALPSLSRTTSCPIPSSASSYPVPPTSRDVLVQHATIFGKKATRNLTAYEQAINNAAINLVLADPALVADRGTLFEKAKAKLIDDGYTYKRGISRSKLNPAAPLLGQRTSKDQIRLKRNQNAAMTSETRQQRISNLEEKLTQKERERDNTEDLIRTRSARDPTAAEGAQHTLHQIEVERTQLFRELSALKAKERKHQWYEKRKKERGDSGFGEEDMDDGSSSLFGGTEGSSIIDEEEGGEDDNKSDSSERVSRASSSQDAEIMRLEQSVAQTLGEWGGGNSRRSYPSRHEDRNSIVLRQSLSP